MDSDAVRDDILEQVLPDDAEREENQERFARIQTFIADEFDRDAELMGSTAKHTFMSGDKDLDIFVFFPTDVPEDDLEETGLEIGKAVFDEFDGGYEVDYAEHPYTRGVIDGYDVEIVPAYRVETGEDIRSSVDRTPFHTAWVNEQLSDEEKEEVVLLKAFLRGQELYGSTLKVEGFSGYLCELLIAVYGSFEAVLEVAVEWDEKQVLDPDDHHDVLPNYLKQKFGEEQLVVIDPVDPERNVASVLSNENYARFIYVAWQYLQQPGTAFFFPEQESVDINVEAAAETRGDFVTVTFSTPDLIDDILYPQLRRLMRRLTQVLEDNEFRIFHSGFHVGEEQVRLVFELYHAELPATRKQVGPKPFHNLEHLENFTDKYGVDNVWVEDDRLVTLVEREYTDAAELLDELLSGDLKEKGVPKQLAPVVEDREIGGLEPDGEEWGRFLRETFRL